jgi:glycosyltransferase involved in cell wall biosynthesis
MTRVVVAMPAYNEEKYVASTVLKCRKHFKEVYVIDDQSKDLTGEMARRAGAKVIRHRQNQGYGGALRTAFLLGKEQDVDCLVILDSDGQHDPNEIPRLVEPILKGKADLVIGSRFKSREGRSTIPRYRILGIQAITQVFNLGTNLSLTDSQSGFRAYSKNALKHIKVTSDRMDASMEILFDAKDHKFKIIEVPIVVKYEGVEGSSEEPFSHGFKVIGNTLKMIRERYPIRFFGYAGGLLIFIIPFVILYARMYHPVDTGIMPIGGMFVVTTLGIVGTFFIFTGIMLHGVSRISKNVLKILME